MPYASNSELPPAVQKLSRKKQDAFRSAFNSGLAKHGDETMAFKIAWSAANNVKESDRMSTEIKERDFTAEQRKAAAKSGAAMPDGSYPIETKSDLENAIQAIGRASNPAAVKAHIRKRAKALGATDALPDSWSKESYEESAADTAAAKTMQGHFVQDRNEYGSSGIYQVHAVNDDGSAELHGPVGKGGSKTIPHKDLVSRHMDLGPSDNLSQVYAAESHAETGSRKARSLFRSLDALEEAAYDAKTGTLTMTVIKPGLNKSKERYYPPEVLKRDHKIFEGAKGPRCLPITSPTGRPKSVPKAASLTG